MARLQILELPEGTGDDRPPFVLVVDQAPRDETSSAFRRDLEDNKIAAGIGARHVLVFEDTIEIPASDPPPLAEDDQPSATPDDRIMQAHERSRLALCDALLLSRNTTWHQLIEQAAERQRELAGLYRQLDRVRDLPERPEIMDAKHAEPNGYLHGYRIAIRDAKRAVETGG